MATFGVLLKTNLLIIIVCAKLHNVSINRWIVAGKRAEEIEATELSFQQQRDAGVFLHSTDPSLLYNNDIPDEVFGNIIPSDPINRITSERKREITRRIFDAGIRYNVISDNDFTYDNGMA